MKGTIKSWDITRGFGFISGLGGRDYFVHISNWGDGKLDAPEVGTQVEFEIGAGSRGKKDQAINARPVKQISIDSGVQALIGGVR